MTAVKARSVSELLKLGSYFKKHNIMEKNNIVRGFFDPETRMTYYVHLNETDARKADTDEQFAGALFRQAKSCVENAGIQANQQGDARKVDTDEKFAGALCQRDKSNVKNAGIQANHEADARKADTDEQFAGALCRRAKSNVKNAGIQANHEADARKADTDKQFAGASFRQAESCVENAGIQANGQVTHAVDIEDRLVQGPSNRNGIKRDETSEEVEVDLKNNVRQMSNSNGTPSQRINHNWQYDETKLLITCYGNHAEELGHPIKKQSFWDNIVNDLVSHQYCVTKEMCYNKWGNLLRSYKTVKDKKSSTGRGSSRFQFFEQIDEVVGKNPSNSSPHTKSSLEKTKEKVVVKQDEESEHDANSSDMQESITVIKETNNSKRALRKRTSSEVEEKREYRDQKLKLEWAKLESEKKKMELEERKIKAIESYLNNKNQSKEA